MGNAGSATGICFTYMSPFNHGKWWYRRILQKEILQKGQERKMQNGKKKLRKWKKRWKICCKWIHDGFLSKMIFSKVHKKETKWQCILRLIISGRSRSSSVNLLTPTSACFHSLVRRSSSPGPVDLSTVNILISRASSENVLPAHHTHSSNILPQPLTAKHIRTFSGEEHLELFDRIWNWSLWRPSNCIIKVYGVAGHGQRILWRKRRGGKFTYDNFTHLLRQSKAVNERS